MRNVIKRVKLYKGKTVFCLQIEVKIITLIFICIQKKIMVLLRSFDNNLL